MASGDNKKEDMDPEEVKALRAEMADKARKFRQENAGSRDEAALVADLKRVAEDPNLPWPNTCSRAKYRTYGHFSEARVVDLFGNHQEFQREAGLRDTRTTTRYRNQRAKIKTEQRIGEYFKAEVLPWAGKYERKAKGKGPKRIVVGSDFHSQDVDRFALEVFLDVIKRVQPEYVALNGDVLDFPSVSKWSSPPNKLLSLQDEIDWVRDNILRPVREAAPDADVTLFTGNHEARLMRYLADAAPALASLRCLQYPALFGLDELQINIVVNDEILSPNVVEQEKAVKEVYRLYEDCFIVTHGSATGPTAGLREIAKYGYSGTSGHVHKPQFVTAPTLKNPDACWMITGMMAKCPEHGREFNPNAYQWTTGFGFVTIDGGVAIQQQVLIKNGRAEFGGVYYRER